MNVKRALIERLPPEAKRLLAVPYDRYQTRQADTRFANKDLPAVEPSMDAPDHIVCIVVDALRADHVTDKLTPFLADLNGTDAITPGAWTFPAMSSFISGVYPHEHGAMNRTDDGNDSEGFTLPPRMDADRVTLTELLAGAGYDTYGGFGHDTPFVALSGRFATHELYHSVTATADDVLEDHIDWIEGRDMSFSLLHLADPHIPVDPPNSYWDAHNVDRSVEGLENWRYNETMDCDDSCRRYREHRKRLYRAAVDYVDDAIARYVDELDKRFEDDYVLLITADHGEVFWEHVDFDVEHFGGSGCVDHGGAPYEELARVPLLTNRTWPVTDDVSLIDVAPTLLDAVGLEYQSMSGRSLLADTGNERYILVEGSLNGYEKKGIYDGEYKLIVSQGDDVTVGLTVPGDELVEIPPDRRDAMIDALPPWPDGEDAETDVSDVVEDRLSDLGYR